VLIRYSDWKRPTDAAYAFQLRAAEGFAPEIPEPGTRSDIRRVHRWSGPEDVVGEAGERPYAGLQLTFQEHAWRSALAMRELESVMRGNVLVMREEGGQADYVLRDHHMLDVALYHYRTTGELPSALFHADRHSDWCRDSYLEARTPQQAATWWKLFAGLKRPGSEAPVLDEQDVFFATARAARTSTMGGRDVDVPLRIPSTLEPDALDWRHALERPGALDADWLSLDLDYFQPAPQLRVSRGLVRDARFQRLLSTARVRVFVLSPQFTNGGDRIEPWETQGSLHSSLRLVNLLRRRPGRVRLEG
jgi:hypothetical protein